MDVAQTYVEQRLQFRPNLRVRFHEGKGFFDRQRQEAGDRLPFELHFQRFVIVAFAATNVAGHIDVGQEIHLNALEPVPLAGFTAPALHVEAKPTGLVATLPRLGEQRVKLPNVREQAGVGGRVGTRSPANRSLVDADNLIDILNAGNFEMLSGGFVGAVNLLRNSPVKDVIHDGGLATARNARDHHQFSQREFDIDLLEVVLGGTTYCDGLAIPGTPYLRNGDFHFA